MFSGIFIITVGKGCLSAKRKTQSYMEKRKNSFGWHQKRMQRGKVVAFSLLMLAALSAPLGASAQEGLFQRGVTDEAYYGYGGTNGKTDLLGHRSMGATGTIDNQIFGQPVPIGSGVIILLAAGAGYAALKRKEDEQ
jgi:hypothetical protein